MRRILVSASFVLLACGGGGAGTTADPNTAPRAVRGPADLITEAEINASVYQNALEAVQSLRPAMLRARSSAGGQVVLYVDNVKMLDMTGLSTIPATRVREIRYINASDATTRWGTGHASGVILVTTKR
jgi:hypothetical protein